MFLANYGDGLSDLELHVDDRYVPQQQRGGFAYC